MAPRVAVGGIVHETNTFATGALGYTTREQFMRHNGYAADSGFIPTECKGARTCVGGLVDAAAELGMDIVPLFFASHEPSGTINKESYESMRDELLADLAAALPVDAVALDVHGAGVADSYEDIELDLGQAVRALVGPDVPIVSTWDLHGNISVACSEVFDFMCCYMTYPHIDNYERGQEAMRLVPKLLSGLNTTIHIETVPTLLPVACCSTHPGFPAAEMNTVCAAMEAKYPGQVIDCTVFHGFPWADISITATTVVVTTDDDPGLARRVGREVGAWIWKNRRR
jgi:toxic protein SymE